MRIIIKLALKETELRWGMYRLLFVQFFLLFIMLIFATSILGREYAKYAAFEPYLRQDGFYVYLDDIFTPENTGMLHSGMLEKYLKHAEVLSCYALFADIKKENTNLPFTMAIYDSQIIERYKPETADGRWFHEQDMQTDEIEAVIGSYGYDIAVGDTLELHPYGEIMDTPMTIRVIGVLKPEAQYYGLTPSDDMIQYQNFYEDVFQTKSLMILNNDDLSETADRIAQRSITKIRGGVMVTYDERITEEERQYNMQFLKDNAFIVQIESLEGIYMKSREKLKNEWNRYAPLLLLGFAVAMLSTICIGIIAVRRQKKTLALYHMLGLTKNRCAEVAAAVFGIIVFAALICACAAALTVQLTPLNQYVVIELGERQLAGCFVLAPLLAAPGMLYSAACIGR